MRYYVLTINKRMVRDFTFKGNDDGSEVDMYCTFTRDVNLAAKYTRDEVINEKNMVQSILNYLSNFDFVDGVVPIMDWDFVDVKEIIYQENHVKEVVAKNWKDLVGLKNDKYYLDIDTEWGKGWIRDIDTGEGVIYLSTHTFYGLRCTRIAEKLLKNKGFDVKIDVNRMEGE